MAACIFVLFVSFAAAFCDVSSCNNVANQSDRRVDKSVLRIGTMNCAWLFDGVDDPPGSPWKNAAEAEKHIDMVAEEILGTAVDMLAVHEIECCGVLNRLAARLGPAYRYYLLPGTDKATGQNSALITKIDPKEPLARSSARADFPVPGSLCPSSSRGSTGISKHGAALIAASTFSFRFVFAHFKAGRSPRDCAQREAQAVVLRQLARERVIFAGDFNELDDQMEDASGKTGQAQTLRILKGATHFNAAALAPAQARRTLHDSLIDHVLLPNELRSRVMAVSLQQDDRPRRPKERLRRFLSDHRPFVVTLRDEGAAPPTLKQADDDDEAAVAPISIWWTLAALAAMLGVLMTCTHPRR